MGGNMTTRLRRAGHEVVSYDRNPAVSDVPDLAPLGASPRAVWVMVPSGTPTHDAVTTLAGLLGPGDVVVDGGNSNWRDSQAHAAELASKGIGFLDVGVSGGVWGLEEGYALMAGGTDEHVAVLQPVFDALAPEGGFAHVGGTGAGHYTKMVHNGVEYGLMQSYA